MAIIFPTFLTLKTLLVVLQCTIWKVFTCKNIKVNIFQKLESFKIFMKWAGKKRLTFQNSTLAVNQGKTCCSAEVCFFPYIKLLLSVENFNWTNGSRKLFCYGKRAIKSRLAMFSIKGLVFHLAMLFICFWKVECQSKVKNR